MPEQQSLIELTHLKCSTNSTWTFRIDLESIHAPFVETFLHELARSGLFRGGWFVGNWWFDDEAMTLISHLFSNWEEMKAEAEAIESTVQGIPLRLGERSEL